MVDCTGLENRQRETFREFESHRLRQKRAFLLRRVSQLLGSRVRCEGFGDVQIEPPNRGRQYVGESHRLRQQFRPFDVVTLRFFR